MVTKHPKTERLELPVKGMHCAACIQNVERALRSVPGVTDAAVNLATERARVELGHDAARSPRSGPPWPLPAI